MFNFTRKSTSGKSIPSWVKPGPIYVKNHTRKTKYDAPVSPATLLHANPSYAHVRLPSGVETTVSMRDIARQPNNENILDHSLISDDLNPAVSNQLETHESSVPTSAVENDIHAQNPPEQFEPRRSTRVSAPPKRLEDYVVG